MEKPTPKSITLALRKAKYAEQKGTRYYDEKHKTYNPASYVENILAHVSDLLGYHGIEAYEPGDNNPSHPTYQYINSGDTYGLTLIHNANTNRFQIGDIGSVIESTDVQHDY